MINTTDTPSVDRSLTVFVGEDEIGAGCHMKLDASFMLFAFQNPAVLDIWNLSEKSKWRLMEGGYIEVLRGDDVLAYGEVMEVKTFVDKKGFVTRVTFSASHSLMQSQVSLTVPAGTSASDTVRQILLKSGTGMQLLGWQGNDPVLDRPQSFFKRAAFAIEDVCNAAGVKVAYSPQGIWTVPEDFEDVQNSSFPVYHLSALNYHVSPSIQDGNATLMLDPAGWRVGQWIEFQDEDEPDAEYEGLIINHKIAADNLDGYWYSLLTVQL